MTTTQTLEDALYDKGFYIIDNFLNSQDYQSLGLQAQKFYQQGYFKSAKIGRQLTAMNNLLIRKDEIYWLDEKTPDKSLNSYFNKVNAIAEKINQHFFLSLVDFEAHFSIYQPGAFYKLHIDQFRNQEARQISCVYYLNQDWQETMGGELKIYTAENKLLTTVLPQGNRFICFKSSLPHEVCTTHEPRFSIAGWMKTRSGPAFLFNPT